MEKSKTLIVIETILIIGFVIVLLSIPVLAYKSDNFDEGDHFAGMLGTFLSFLGSILVYVAFKAQIKANDTIQKQFEKQNFDHNFFRLIDNIEKRIINSEIVHLKGDKKESGFAILDYIIDEINKNHPKYNSMFGRYIVLTNPECLSDDMWKLFFNEIDGNKYNSFESLKKEFINGNNNQRNKILSEDVVDIQYNTGYDDFILKIFTTYFYEQSQEFYDTYYNYIINRFFQKYIIFFDGYYKSISMILKHIDSITDNKFYLDYLIDNLTTYEKVIIWLAASMRRFSKDSSRRILKFGILESLNNLTGIQAVYVTNYYEHISKRLESINNANQ